MDFDTLCQKYKLGFSYIFVPYSESRNAGKWESLNWKITLLSNGKEVFTTDYSEGVAHCPGYGIKDKYLKKKAISHEIETGFKHVKSWGDTVRIERDSPIVPDYKGVLYSLYSDSSVRFYQDFENWCFDYGYDPDSIKAKGIYDSVRDTYLSINASFGHKFFDDCDIVFADY